MLRLAVPQVATMRHPGVVRHIRFHLQHLDERAHRAGAAPAVPVRGVHDALPAPAAAVPLRKHRRSVIWPEYCTNSGRLQVCRGRQKRFASAITN